MKYIITKPQFNLLVEGKPKLISEGRREELTNKYERKFKEYPEVLSSSKTYTQTPVRKKLLTQ